MPLPNTRLRIKTISVRGKPTGQRFSATLPWSAKVEFVVLDSSPGPLLVEICFCPDNPHPACGHLLPLPRAKDTRRGRLFCGTVALPWAIICRTFGPFPGAIGNFWFNLSARHWLNCCLEDREGT